MQRGGEWWEWGRGGLGWLGARPEAPGSGQTPLTGPASELTGLSWRPPAGVPPADAGEGREGEGSPGS